MISRNGHKHSVAPSGYSYDMSLIFCNFQNSNDSSLDLSWPSPTVILYRQIPLKASAFGCEAVGLRQRLLYLS
jgi:hypothetical protein